MPGVHVKKGDHVAIIAGKDLGAKGRVIEVQPKAGRVIVQGIGTVTRHEKLRTNRRGAQEGGIAHKEAAIDISNVALICPSDGPTRVGYRIDEASGAKARICRKCGTEL